MLSKEQISYIEQQWEILGHSGLGYTEVRAILTNGKIGVYFSNNKEKFLDKINYADLTGADIYVGINPRASMSGKAEDVRYLTCLVADLDPIRSPGTPSTDSQHKAAISQANLLASTLPHSVVVSSGSGAHIYVPIEPIEINGSYKEITKFVSDWTANLRKQLTDNSIKIDSIFDLSRVIRVWGSRNNKSNRLCYPLNNYIGRLDLHIDISKIQLPKTNGHLPIDSNLEEKFEKLIKVNPTVSKMMKGEMEFPSRSEADYLMVKLLLGANFNRNEIIELAKRNPLGRGEEMKDADADRIICKLNSNNGSVFSSSNGTDDYFRNLPKRGIGYSTGFVRLDEMLAGLKGGQMYVVAARTNEGKTSFLTQVGLNLAKTGLKVLYFPTELGSVAIFDKMVSAETEINLRKFQTGKFTEQDLKTLELAKEKMNYPVIINENFGLTVEDIHRKVTEVAPDVVIVDYLQSMKYEEGGSPRELADNVRQIKEIAGKYNIPTLLSSQLHRGAVGAEASLTQLKGSGATEELADVVMFINTLDRNQYPRPINLMIMKSRYGETGNIRMEFYSSICKFKEKE